MKEKGYNPPPVDRVRWPKPTPAPPPKIGREIIVRIKTELAKVQFDDLVKALRKEG